MHKGGLAVFVHCTAHRLNLMVHDTFIEVHSLSFSISQVNALVTFYRDSPKRNDISGRRCRDEPEASLSHPMDVSGGMRGARRQ